MKGNEKHLLIVAALLALAYWLYKKYGGGVTTTVQTTMLPSGQSNQPSTTIYDAAGNPTASNEELLGPYTVQGVNVPPNAGPAILLNGAWTAPVGYHPVDYGGTVPVIVPNTPSPQQKIASNPGVMVRGVPKSELIHAGTKQFYVM